MVQGSAKAFGALQQATGADRRRRAWRDPDEAGAAATEYLRLFGLVALGFMWARDGEDRGRKAAGGRRRRRRSTRPSSTTARFYMERILPQAGALLVAIKAGKAPMMALDEAAF